MKARVALVVLVAALFALPAASVAAVAEPDFATENYGDAWDFSNAADFAAPQRAWSTKGSNFAIQNGLLSFDMGSMGEVALVRGFRAITIPWGRDGSLLPIDATRYTHMSFRLNAAIAQPTGGQITWMTCGTLADACMGAMAIQIKPGWNTYDVELRKTYDTVPMEWNGFIQSLTLVPIGQNVSSAHVEIDWVRLYQPNGTSTGPVNKMAPTPMLGSDYASIVRGDPWDMAQPTDVGIALNSAMTFSGGVLHGQNSGPVMNDPWMTFPTPAPFSGSRFHRFSIRVYYDGVFSLEDNVGGGMNARLYWNVAGSDVLQTSQDILVYPGWQTITLDLNAPDVIDETQPNGRIGWAGQTITFFRFDPNEDRGGRNWKIDWVRLGSDRPFGSFDVAQRTGDSLSVAGWAIDPNTTASTLMRVFVDGVRHVIPVASLERNDVAAVFPAFGNRHGFEGVVPLGPGSHRVCVWAINIGPGDHGLIGCRVV